MFSGHEHLNRKYLNFRIEYAQLNDIGCFTVGFVRFVGVSRPCSRRPDPCSRITPDWDDVASLGQQRGL